MSNDLAEKTLKRMREVMALLLWDTEAIRINLDEPFKLVSGNCSPIYVNCRCVISDPSVMRLFSTVAQFLCMRRGVETDVVAGGETAGIPFAAYVAQALGLPMAYVRKAKKEHGLANLVEGCIPEGANVLLVEDLITDGGSKLGFIEGIRSCGGKVRDVLVLFDRLQGGGETLAEHGMRLWSSTDMDVTLAVAEAERIMSGRELEQARQYLDSPREWHEQMGLEYHG